MNVGKRKSFEEVLEIVKNYAEQDKTIKFLEMFITTDEKMRKKEKYTVKFEHLICGSIIEMPKYRFMNGHRCSNPECVKKKREQTCIEKYGVKNAGWTKESQEKIKSTNLSKYV